MRAGEARLSAASPGRRRPDAGFTYVGLLFAVALLSAGASGAAVMWQSQEIRFREDELLFVGRQFRVAICRYYHHTSGDTKRFPRSLDELLVDRRQGQELHHLRRLFRDPMTGQAHWGLLRTATGEITGVYSLSRKKPMKVAHFKEAESNFASAATYGGWTFDYVPSGQAPDRASCA